MKKILTGKEQDFWDKLMDYYFEHLIMPTREEMSRYSKMSPQLVQYYLGILRGKGWLKKVGIGKKTIKH